MKHVAALRKKFEFFGTLVSTLKRCNHSMKEWEYFQYQILKFFVPQSINVHLKGVKTLFFNHLVEVDLFVF